MGLNSFYRRNILGRRVREQGGRCCYCRRPFAQAGPTRATIEHRKARMDGGTDRVANLAAACLHCNQHRGRQMSRDRAKGPRRAGRPPESAPPREPG